MILIYRRRTTGPVFMATTKNDKMMYIVLVGAIVLGLWTTVLSVGAGRERAQLPRDRRRPGSARCSCCNPTCTRWRAAPLEFQIHALVGMLLFTIWPFTRLVHAFTAPLHYLFRPYIVYRSRDARPAPATSAPQRGWDPVGTRDRDR